MGCFACSKNNPDVLVAAFQNWPGSAVNGLRLHLLLCTTCAGAVKCCERVVPLFKQQMTLWRLLTGIGSAVNGLQPGCLAARSEMSSCGNCEL